MTRNRADQVVRVTLNNSKDFTEFDNLFSELEIFENLRLDSSCCITIVVVSLMSSVILSWAEIACWFDEFPGWLVIDEVWLCSDKLAYSLANIARFLINGELFPTIAWLWLDDFVPKFDLSKDQEVTKTARPSWVIWMNDRPNALRFRVYPTNVDQIVSNGDIFSRTDWNTS